MFRLFTLFFFSVFTLFYAESQTMSCGTIAPAIAANFANPGELLGVDRPIVTKNNVLEPQHFHFPLRFVVFNDKVGEMSKAVIQQQVDKLNLAFKGANISFFERKIKRVTDSDLEKMTPDKEAYLYENYFQEGIINVYIFLALDDGNEKLDGYTYTPTSKTYIPPHRQNMIALSFMGLMEKTVFAHELGHFFGLHHTHETVFGAGLVSGKDCLRTGDLICDTPADPNLYKKVLSNPADGACKFGDADKDRDAEGQQYQPSVYNIMSYSSDECRSEFTKGQYWIMERVAMFYRSSLATSSKTTPKGIHKNKESYSYFTNLSTGKQDVIYDPLKSKTVIISFHHNVNWCNRLFYELRNSSSYQPFFDDSGSFNLVVYEVDIERESLIDFLGNESLSPSLMSSFIGELSPEIVRYPGVYIVDFEETEQQYLEVLFARRGYVKTRELVKILQAIEAGSYQYNQRFSAK